MRGLLGVGAVALSLVLTGCVGGGSSAGPTPTSTPSRPPSSAAPTPTSSPTPSATASAVPVPDESAPSLDELVLATGGFEQLPLASDPALSPLMTFEVMNCGEGFTVDAWRSVYDGDGVLGPFSVAIAEDGLVAAIQVFSSEITTPQGIGPGSTRDEVLAAYPGISVAGSNNRYDVYTVEAADGRLEIGVAHNRDYEAWESSQLERVAQVIAARLQYSVYLPGFHPIGASCM